MRIKEPGGFIFVLPGRSQPQPKRKKRYRTDKQIAKRRAKYQTYLRSPKWAAFRTGIIRERGAICERCRKGCANEAHLHHLTYIRLGNELPRDVQVLCRACHQAAHPGKVF